MKEQEEGGTFLGRGREVVWRNPLEDEKEEQKALGWKTGGKLMINFKDISSIFVKYGNFWIIVKG